MTPKDYAILARDAYTTAPNIGEQNSAGRVILNHLPEGLVLAIPGTNNLSCVEADVDALLYDAKECGMVHAGIWGAFSAVWPEVSKLYAHALVGHSEGAAGAIYLAAQLCLIGKAPEEVWAFEPPRTSIDDKLATIFLRYGCNVKVYHHGRDIVPMVPLDIPLEPWRHPVTDVIHFGKPSSIWPNVADHMMDALISDL